MSTRTLGLAAAFCAAAFPVGAAPAASGGGLALGPLTLSGDFRVRYETLSGQYRAGLSGSDQALALQTLLKAELDLDAVKITAEAVDAREYLDDSGSFIDNTAVNPIDLLQAKAAASFASPFAQDRKATLTGGRFTLTLGARRLVARHGFRQGINTFTGAHLDLPVGEKGRVQALYVLPVDRLPIDRAALLDNTPRTDKQSFDNQFYGVYTTWPAPLGAAADIYALRIDERDNAVRQTRDRRFTTFGVRIVRAPSPGAVDFEFESAGQIGTSRASSSAGDTRDLAHRAHFQHGEIGYTLDHPLKPRFALEADHASGDRDPTDGEFNRFDLLYGARGFEFATTGIYGPITRSNLLSAGARVDAEPSDALSGFLAYRAFFLASPRDQFPSARYADPTGESGRFLGHHVEIGLRWRPREFLELSAGAAHLTDGRFRREAPASPKEGPTSWSFVQTKLSF